MTTPPPAGPLRLRWHAFAALPRGIRRRFLWMIAPWSSAVLIGFPWLWSELENTARAPLLRSRDSVLIETLDILQRTVNSLRQDAILLSDLAAPLPPSSTEAQQLFMTFARSAGAYAQVRWIDAAGMERIRISTQHGLPQLVPEQALQSKADRPYFVRSVQLPPGNVYLSSLELNTEQGAGAPPPEPTLRITAPIHVDERGQGIVAINYRAARLLERLGNLGQRQRLGVYLVNTAGYWLNAPRSEDSWAWQRDKPERTLQQTHPALWSAITAADQGTFSDGGGDWAFARFYPDATPALEDSERKRMVSDLGLQVLVHIAPDVASQWSWRSRAVLLAILACVVYFGLRVGWHSLGRLIDEDTQSRQLQAANLALQEANDNLQTVQADLARAERLSSLGLMVAGVAHELNTPLGSAGLALSTVQQAVTQLQEQLHSGLRRSELDRFLTQAGAALDLTHASIRRASGIVQRFKQVAVDRTTMERRLFDLAEIIQDADPRLRRWDPQSPIALRLDLPPGVTMHSYPGPLGQVISNLLTNALAHAFKGRSHGQIAIQAAEDGPQHVVIRVCDDGMGIAPEHRDKIFDPFFTTHRHAGGSGLGLHISYQLVTEMLGGKISLEGPTQGMGSGTTFALRLPREAPEQKR